MTKHLLYFAVVPDGDREPIAVFRDLDEAMVWALGTLGSTGPRVPGPAA